MTTGSEFPGLAQIGQIAIIVQDVERATAFYRDTLGMRFLFAFPGLAFFDCGGGRLMLSRAEDPQLDHPASILYYPVADIEATHQALAPPGARLERGPHLVAR